MRTALAVACFAAALFPARASCQVVARTNQIRGTVSFANVNPEVRAEIDRASVHGQFAWRVSARSVTESTQLEAFVQDTTDSRASLDYVLTVDVDDDGVGYEVAAEVYDGWDHSPWQLYPPEKGSTTVWPEPASDAVVNLTPCASLLRFTFVDAAGTPVAVDGGTVTVRRGGFVAWHDIEAGSTSTQLLGPGNGNTYEIAVTWMSGSDVTLDTVTRTERYDAVLGCDTILTNAITVVPPTLGRIVGTFDVLGFDELPYDDGWPQGARTQVNVRNGPWLNERYAILGGTPASGAFALENLVASSAVVPPRPYELSTHVLLDHEGRAQELTSRRMQVSVPEGATVDLGDSYVMTPSIVSIDQLLVGPPPGSSPGGAVLADCTAADEPNFNRPMLLGVQAAPETTLQAWVDVEGGFDEITGEIRRELELIVAAPSGSVPQWRAPGVTLGFYDRGTPGVPVTHRHSTVTVTPSSSTAAPIAPGSTLSRDLHLCLSQLDLEYIDLDGTFRQPSLTWYSVGSFHGEDFEGVEQHRDVRVVAEGWPGPIGFPSDWGLVVTGLPEGEYVLRPAIQAANPGGPSSFTELRPLSLTVGCGQVIGASPHIAVSVEPPPSCPGGGLSEVRVRVDAALPVASIVFTVDGRAPETVCAPCTGSPVRLFSAALGPGRSELKVQATDARGRVATTTSWVETGHEPSAGSVPLRVTRGADPLVRLEWEATDGQPADVFVGSLVALHEGRYDHAAVGACELSAGSVEIAASPAAWFVVGGTCNGGPGPLGRDSFGRALPQPVVGCR